MNGRVIVAGLVAAGCLLAQPAAGQRGRGPMGAGGPGMRGALREGPAALAATVTGAPYSGVEVRTMQQTLAAGGVIQRTEQTNVYRDSQGRVRRETTIKEPDGQTNTRITISDPVAGLLHNLDAKSKTAFTRPLRTPTGSGRLQAMGRGMKTGATDVNLKKETLPARSINGMLASGTRVTRTIPAGTIGNSQALETTIETWTGDDLKVPLLTKVTDPRMGTRTMELTNVNRSQPDPSLFQIPSDYTQRKGMGMMGRGPGAARME